MKLKYIPLLVIAVGSFSSCFNPREPNRIKNAEVSKDTLQYQYQTTKLRAGDCGNKPDSNCTSAILKYPVFAQQPALNDTVNSRLAQLCSDSTTKGATVKKVAADLIVRYETDKKNGSIPTKQMHYELSGNAEVIRQDTLLLTLQLTGYRFVGGAHGMSLTKFINWEPRTHKNLTMDDVFISGYLPELNKVADTIFRKEENLSPTATLANDYFFKDAKFSVNNNFLITPLGIRFLYNVYEIKPYAAGTTSIDIPYAKIKKLLRPGTAAAIYSK